VPKQILKIDDFSGGINDHSDPRDIDKNESCTLVDASINSPGILKTLGSKVAHDSNAVGTACTITAGYGLFAFSSDYDSAGDGDGTAGSANATDYLIFCDTDSSALVHIWDGSAWHNNLGDLGSAWKPVFYYVDGALRIADANLVNTTKWYGHIVRDRYTELSASYQDNVHTTNINEWVLDDAHPRSATDLLTDTYKHYPQFTVQARTTGSGGNENPESDDQTTYNKWGQMYTGQKHAPHIRLYSALDAASSGGQFAGGSGWDKVWNCAYTLIYDGVGTSGQESALHVIQDSGGTPIYNNDGTTNSNHPMSAGTLAQGNAGDSDLGNITQSSFAGRKAKLYAYIPSPANSIGTDTQWNKRITGFNIYMKEYGTTDWYLQAEVDLNLGIKDITTGSRSLKGWQETDVDGVRDAVLYTVTDPITSPSKLITYEANTTYGEEKHNTSTKFKTGVIANRRAWIGNIKFYHDDGTEKARPDAIVKSPVGKFDVFTESNLVEVTVSDGDEIIKLEEFSDRLFEFKKNKMTIINIAQSEGEFVESTHQHLGIAHPSAVCKTEFGIAWVNSNGAYMYDGQKINFLLEKNNIPVISKSTWSSFITANSSVGYNLKTRQLFILKSASSSGVGDLYIYDLTLRSWSSGDTILTDNTLQTNFINDSNGDLVWGSGTETIYKYDDDPSIQAGFKYETKDFDFGAPSVAKKIYKVYISYKGDGQNIYAKYGINGETDKNDYLNFCGTNTDGSSTNVEDDTPFLDDNDKEHWINAELKPAVSINNIYSFRLYLYGSAGADFEINDISIVYRLKGIK
jgi:hypothetical protein